MTVAQLIDAIPSKSAEQRRQMRENARRAIEAGRSRAPEAKALLEALDAFEARERDRRMQAPPGSARVALVLDAFRKMPRTEPERELVQVVLDHPDASSERLTHEIGWHNQAWQLHFGKLCERREHLLWVAPFEAKRNDRFYSGILAEFDEITRGFTLKPEVVEAFARLGLRPRRTS
jgi:hypothetical protein